MWHYRLKKSCQRPDGSRGLVLDVGGNFGWYSLYAAAMGCRVIAWEPVPIFRDFFKYGVAINGFGHLIQVPRIPLPPYSYASLFPSRCGVHRLDSFRIGVYPRTQGVGLVSKEGCLPNSVYPRSLGACTWVE